MNVETNPYLVFVKNIASDETLSNVSIPRVQEALKFLSEREQTVLILRFGLDNEPCKRLEVVAKKFNVTRDRIRQIEAKAVRKLRHPSRVRLLTDPLSPDQTVKQMFCLEWMEIKKPLPPDKNTVIALESEMGVHGWRIPRASEIQSALQEGVTGFNPFAMLSRFWTCSENGDIYPTYFERLGKIGSVANTRRANLFFVRTISGSGRIVD